MINHSLHALLGIAKSTVKTKCTMYVMFDMTFTQCGSQTGRHENRHENAVENDL